MGRRLEASRKTVLVFGPQPLAFNQDSFHNLRAAIASFSTLNWIPGAIGELPSYFDSLCVEFPKLRVLPGVEQLQALSEWLDTGSLTGLTTSPRVPNILLTPLCVISQLAAYNRYLGLSYTELEGRQNTNAHSLENTETAGFCTGLLAALAVSLSATHAELEHHGATAVRLAMLIGAIVDAEDALDGGSTSFSAVWRTAEGFHSLEEILQDYHNVNIPSSA